MNPTLWGVAGNLGGLSDTSIRPTRCRLKKYKQLGDLTRCFSDGLRCE
ncbi:hypothetical protein [Neisseria weaveri]|nr:hypothetical protein [Neisseria weaveri]